MDVRFRFADVLGALSLATDLANGNPLEKALRTCLLSVELAREVGASSPQLVAAYYAAMLRFIGGTAYAHELAERLGDDIQAHQVFAPLNPSRPTGVLAAAVTGLDGGAPPLRRARALANVVLRGPQLLADDMAENQCEVAVRLAFRLGLPPEILCTLGQLQERYDGTGTPHGLGGDALALPTRVLHVANIAEIYHHQRGAPAACAEVQRRSGGHLDPQVAAAFLRRAPELLARVEQRSVWDDVLAAEPGTPLLGEDLDRIAGAFADFVDLGSVYTLGHSQQVARLAEQAGADLGLPEAERTRLRRAGLLHDLGSVSVPSACWEKPGPLTAVEWERVRLHPYYTERILARSPALAPLAELAGAHHERLDASGYFRGAPAAYLCTPARVLAAADHYQALIEARAHRPAHAPADAARMLAREASDGRLDKQAVQAVLAAAGHRGARVRGARPGGLTAREIEVLRWLAQGLTNKEIAQRMAISARTVQTHALHIYGKIGVSSRTGAALFAIEHDLVHGAGEI